MCSGALPRLYQYVQIFVTGAEKTSRKYRGSGSPIEDKGLQRTATSWLILVGPRLEVVVVFVATE